MALFRTGLCLILLAVVVNGEEEISATWVNGDWSPWSTLKTPCHVPGNERILVNCGGGVRKTIRSCTNPKPQRNGTNCEGDGEKWAGCNTHPCQLPGVLLWSQWSECSAKCGMGKRSRYSMCGRTRLKVIGPVSAPETNDTATTSDDETGTTESSSTDAPDENQNPNILKELTPQMQLEYAEPCRFDQWLIEKEDCNTWNRDLCQSPCETIDCPRFAHCIDTSTITASSYRCECKLGTVTKSDNESCIAPQPDPITKRPDPIMDPDIKMVATILTRTASFVLIGFVAATLLLFGLARIFDPGRIIHTNMEIALLMAHIFLMLPPSDNEDVCSFISITIHFFFTACFVFMLMESIYIYALVGWVVKTNGLLTKKQNAIAGWSIAFVIVLFNMCFEYDNYGGGYHCWLNMGTSLVFGQYLPIVGLVFLTFTIVEAAGNASDYEKLDGVDEDQRNSAKVMQRSLVIILPLIFASFVMGTVAEYEQDIYVYGIFTIINGVIGGVVFFFHTSANETIRAKVRRVCCKAKKDKDAVTEVKDE